MQTLRTHFIQTFGEEVELVSDEVREIYNAQYWLAVVRVKRPVTIIFRHTFEQTHSYRHMDIESRIVVADTGCQRTLRPDLRPQTFCVGDTLILPIVIGAHTNQHAFSRVSRFPQYYDSPFSGTIDTQEVENPTAAHLRYLGREAHVAMHRAGREASVSFVAFFEATGVGRFNLRLSPRITGAMQHYPSK